MRVLAVIAGVVLVALGCGCSASSISPTDTISIPKGAVREITANPVQLPSTPTKNP
jgi:hypothetical protein